MTSLSSKQLQMEYVCTRRYNYLRTAKRCKNNNNIVMKTRFPSSIIGCLILVIVLNEVTAVLAFMPNNNIMQPCTNKQTLIRRYASSRKPISKSNKDRFTRSERDLMELKDMKRDILNFLQRSKYNKALNGLEEMFTFLNYEADMSDFEPQEFCKVVDDVIQSYTRIAFSPPFRGSIGTSRVALGMKALNMQLSGDLAYPYNKVSRLTLFSALRALSSLQGSNDVDDFSHDNYLSAASGAYRVLQRLVTGEGIRDVSKNDLQMHEKEFNMVINAFSNIGRMNMAHRVIALQERTKHAPPLTPVAYSILLKGYGKLADLNNIDMIVSHVAMNAVIPDTILFNSLIDAYINCGQIDKAFEFFDMMRYPDKNFANSNKFVLSEDSFPRPDRHSYNTIMKGLANEGKIIECLELSNEMKKLNLWDAISTNTLVNAAVVAQDFETAEEVLSNYTVTNTNDGSRSTRWHPNVEAYTQLLDGYAKAGNLDKAIEVLKTMKSRNVQPNTFTYGSMIGAFARDKKVSEAFSLLQHMEKSAPRPVVTTYNAFISGLLADDEFTDQYETDVDQAIGLLRRMIKNRVRPNAITVAVIVDSFARCRQPRVAEAKALVSKLSEEGYISPSNNKVATTLVKVCGRGDDFKGAIGAFKRMAHPDTAAVNAILDAAARCGKNEVVMKMFEHYFSIPQKATARPSLTPDVISYSVVISTLLKTTTANDANKASGYYQEMKQIGIMPDNCLVDLILKGMITSGRNRVLNRGDARFIANVVDDADKLAWAEGRLERRKRAVRDALKNVWKNEQDLQQALQSVETKDELFRRKGWNKVDSGFRLWGSNDNNKDGDDDVDEFLQSKGWNNVDSGFKII